MNIENVISLDERRRARGAAGAPAGAPAPATFFFDLALPQTYLAAERVERSFRAVRWVPAYADVLWRGNVPFERLAAEAELRAAALGEPLVWPEPMPATVRPAMRAAALACDLGVGACFVLAAGRLAFCGGFDLGDPEVLAEAAAAAGLSLESCLEAARDATRDEAMAEQARRLDALGATELPALRVGQALFGGERRLPEAVAAATHATA